MEFEAYPQGITLPRADARLCDPKEPAEPGDWRLTEKGWSRLTYTASTYCNAEDGQVYATMRKTWLDPEKLRRRPTVLTKAEQEEVRSIWRNRPTYRKLAKQYGCSPDLICAIVTNRNERRRKQKVCHPSKS